MLFNSITFVFFFFFFFILFSRCPQKLKKTFLLFSSYLFYGWWDFRFLSLLILSTCIDYFLAILIDRAQSIRRKKLFLLLSIFSNLGILAFFKYYNFFADSLQDIFHLFGFVLTPATLHLILPVGISFYTFQTMSYSIDVYRKEIPPERHFLNFAIYVAYFPQLVAGPIERAKHLLPQLNLLPSPTQKQFQEGLWLILWGYFLKTVIADNIGKIADPIFSPTENPWSNLNILLGVIAFSLQIYGDFAGYSKIAQGISKWFGIELSANFNHPFFSQNPSDFWRRWHISLSSWLRDYLYIPLGGNRLGTWKTYRNLIITMLLGGLWHGAAVTFIVWGLYHGIGLSLHRFIEKKNQKKNQKKKKFALFFSILPMFIFSSYGWLIFRSDSLLQIQQLTSGLLYNWWWPLNFRDFYIETFWLFWSFFIIICVELVQEQRQKEYLVSFEGRWIDWFVGLSLFSIIFLFGATSKTFIYYQF